MKVRRYQYGRSNVSELQAGRGAIRSPQEAARDAYAPYGAVAEAAGAISDDLLKLQDARDRITDAEDASKHALAETQAETARKLALKQAEVENWTPEQLQERNDEIIREYMGTIEGLSDRNRDRFSEAMGAQSSAWLAESDLNAQVIGAKQTKTRFDAARALAEEEGDYARAGMLLEQGGEVGAYAPEYVDAEKRRYSDNETLENITQGYYAADDKDAFYADVVSDTSMNPALRDAVIKRIESEAGNIAAIEKKHAQERQLVLEDQFTNMYMGVKTGQVGVDTVEDWYNSIRSEGNDTLTAWAQGKRRSLLLASLEGAKTQVDNSVYARNLARGPGATTNSTENQKSLQAYANEVTPDEATPEQRVLIENALTRAAGYPPYSVQQELKAAGNGINAGPLVRAATRVLEITDGDPYTGVDLGLEGRELANIMRVANGIRSKQDPTAIAEEVVAYNKKWRDDQGVADALQKQAGVVDTDKMFTELINEAYDGVFRWEAEMTASELTTAKIRFDQYYREAYIMSDGDAEAAKMSAAMRFQQTHAETYINGEAELQFNGIRAGSEELGDTLFESDLVGNTYIGLDETGSSVVTIGDRDQIKFRNPRVVDGYQEYQVYYNERPMFSEDEQGRRSVFVRVDEGTELALQDAQDAAKITEIREEISDLESDLRAAERMKDNTYRMGESGEKLRDIPKEIARLQAQIKRLQ